MDVEVYMDGIYGCWSLSFCVKVMIFRFGLGLWPYYYDIISLETNLVYLVSINFLWVDFNNALMNIECVYIYFMSTINNHCTEFVQKPGMRVLPTTDFMYNMTSRNISDWIVKTTTDFRLQRYKYWCIKIF